MTYAQRHGGPSQLAAERLVALLTSPSNGTSGTLAQSLHDCLFFLASPEFSQPFDGGVSTSIAAELQPGSQGEGTILEMSLHFPIQSRVGVSHNLRTGNANGQQMETSEIQSSGQFFLSYLTNANLRAIFLLEDQRFLLKPIFVVRNQLLSQLLNCNRPFIVSECPYPGAIHAGYLSKLGGGHFSKREDRNSNLCSSLLFVWFQGHFCDFHLDQTFFFLG